MCRQAVSFHLIVACEEAGALPASFLLAWNEGVTRMKGRSSTVVTTAGVPAPQGSVGGCSPFGIHPNFKMATKSVRGLTTLPWPSPTRMIWTRQGSNLICHVLHTSIRHNLKADKKSSRHCSFVSECSHESIRPQHFSFSVPSFGKLLRLRNSELVYNAADSITPIQWSASNSPRANSEITSKT